jgi:serine/threonine-protein kinase
VGQYGLFDEIASGGMAVVHYGRVVGPPGAASVVAIKRLHPNFARDEQFVTMLIDEARVAARIRHPNVVTTFEVIVTDGEPFLVMEHVLGLTLAHALRESAGRPMPVDVALGIVAGALHGLHAAHEACTESGEPLQVVHRDVSPDNVLVGADGTPRVVDFGIAKAIGRLQTTHDGRIKGKSGYMAPEQIRGRPVDRRTDVYSAAVVLWEALCGRRLFKAEHPAGVMNAVLELPVPPAWQLRPEVPAALADVIAKGMSREPSRRFATAREMAVALAETHDMAPSSRIAEWLASVAPATLAARSRAVVALEAALVDDVAIRDEPAATSEAAPSAAPDRARARRTRRTLLALAGAGALTAGAIFVLHGRASPLAVREAIAPDASTPLADTAPPAELASGAAPSATVSSAAVSAEPTPAPAHASAPPRARTKRPARAVVPSTPLNCTPPYTLDGNGTRHWKNGC